MSSTDTPSTPPGSDEELRSLRARLAACEAELAEAREKAAFYERVFHALPVEAVVLDPHGRYRAVSESGIGDAALRRWIVGKTDEDYARRRGRDPDIGRRRMALVAEAVRTRRPAEGEEALPAADGEVRQYVRTVTPVLDAAGEPVFVIGHGHDVTEQRRAEEALRRSERRFRELFESAMDAILISRRADGFVEVNARACDLTGYTRAELLVMRPEDLLVEGDESDAERWEGVDQGDTYRFESVIRRKDGSTVAVEVSAGIVEGGLMHAIVRDISERKDAERAMVRLTEFYEHVLNQVPIQMAVLDAEGRYLFINPAAVRDERVRRWMIGRTTAEYGRAFHEDPAPFEERYRWLRQVARGSEVREHEEMLVTRAGEVRYILRVAAPIVGRNGDVQVVAFGLDLTERKRFEQQLLLAKEEAEAMTRLKSAFLANMSHEIRTPLTSIIGFSAILAEEAAEPQRELAQLIQRGGTRLLETLNSVLELSMLQSGSFSLELAPIDLVAVARECVTLCRPIADARALTLTVEAADDALFCALDEPSIARVLQNLIGNAIKFTEEGGVSVVVERAGDRAIVRVRDTGVGIDAEFQEHLFDEFKQESTGWKRAYEGSGLGLAITRRLVELMHGTISVESAKRAGSTFIVSFPLGADAIPKVARAAGGTEARVSVAKGS